MRRRCRSRAGSQRCYHRGDEGSPPGQPPAVRHRGGYVRRSACGRLSGPAGSNATTSGSPRVGTGPASTPSWLPSWRPWPTIGRWSSAPRPSAEWRVGRFPRLPREAGPAADLPEVRHRHSAPGAARVPWRTRSLDLEGDLARRQGHESARPWLRIGLPTPVFRRTSPCPVASPLPTAPSLRHSP